MPWHEAFKRLTNYAQSHDCTPPSPPKPLILAGWVYSNDVEKMQRWKETIDWARKNGCGNLVSDIVDRDFYFVEEPTSYMVGPMGGPMYRYWDSDAKNRPSSEQITQSMEILLFRWSEVVGSSLLLTRRLLHHGVGGRIFPKMRQSDEPSLPYGPQSTEPSLRMKSTTLISEPMKTQNRTLQRTRKSSGADLEK